MADQIIRTHAPAAGKRKRGGLATALWNIPAFRGEARELLGRRMAGGRVKQVWGAGAFARHIVFGLLDPVSICGRFVGEVSTNPMPTPIGVPCPTCVRVWNRALSRHAPGTGSVGQKAVDALADELDLLVGSGGIDAAMSRLLEADCGPALRNAALDLLDERGVGLRGMLAARAGSAASR